MQSLLQEWPQSGQPLKLENSAASEVPGGVIDLHQVGTRSLIAERIRKDIDAYCVTAYHDGKRNHLGASLIGKECSRELWYTFRWVYEKINDGRMYRLWNRGHREEARFMEWLRGIGFTITDQTEEGKQFRMSGVHGHFGGSLDGRASFPERYNIKQKLVLAEFKTNATGSGFNAIKEKGVRVAKPEHFGQMSSYGRKYQLEFALYMCINKNDDDIAIEIVQLDWKLGEELENKALSVITSEVPPAKIAMSEAFYKCKFCDYVGVCHRNEPIQKNCRSCIAAVPGDEATWFCRRFNQTIPSDFIAKGCEQWQAIV